MPTRNRILVTLLAAGSIALAIPPSVAADPMSEHIDCHGQYEALGHREGVPPMMKGLKLTSEQRARISGLRKQDADLMDEKLKHVRDTRMQLDEMLMRGEYDELEVKKLTEEGGRVMAELEQLRARQQHHCRAFRTPA